MDELTEEEIENLSNTDLIKRMDQIICSESFDKRSFYILKLNVSSILNTKRAKQLKEKFQRKLAYSVFGMILQIKYTELALLPHPELPGDKKLIEQFSWAERKQWMIISSRIIFEYFMNIIYMIETGKELKGKSKFKEIKKWLKQPDNKFNYFAISIARAKKYSRYKREPEIHAATKIAKKVLTLSAHQIDNSIFDLFSIIQNQWQFVISIADNKEPNSYSIILDEFNDEEWYELLAEGDREKINSKIDEMMND